ncbi:histone deacetylase 5 isoform X4 [Andrographis paniculata]|uniref:histone deacetylase 5 isoform X4 n=1 Tax=Andrographis paniculata TaxID=175694 RepID=UPI0021E853BD|nr:histone deacetylase 5 isoform X4 [Andrographis paniculata]
MESSGGSETSLSRRGCDNAPTRKDRRVGLIYDERMCGHYATEDGDHPECPDRIRAIWKSLESCGFAKRCVVLDAKNAEDNHIALVHSRNHINLIKNTISKSTQSGRRRIASSYNSIYFSKGSSEAAYLAAGSVIEVAEKVAEGQLDSSFAIVRPPGHHAEVDEPMGFCLYNNVAIAASFLLNERKDLGINKILIVDWDVHHGNGTQKMFYSDPRVLFFSVHRHDFGTFYPTGDNGSYIMIGEGPGVGYNINVPWENGRCGDVDYLAVWDHILIPIAKEFNPDIILISAGFDAAIRDPLGGCRVTPYGYSIMLEKLMPFARGKIVMALEGGYNLDSIANSVQACVGVLLGDSPIAGSPQSYPFESTWRVIHQVRQELRAHWPIIASKLPNKVFSKPSPQMDASERGFVGPHSAAAESVARTRIRPGPPPLAPVLLAPSEATAVLHQATHEINFLTRVPLLGPARPIVMRCADLSFADLSPGDFDSLAQVAIDLLVQTPVESAVAPILSRMIERIIELQADLPLIRPSASDTAPSQPAPDTAAIEASLTRVTEDLDAASTQLSELQHERHNLAAKISQKMKELEDLQKELETLDKCIQEEGRLVTEHRQTQASLHGQLQASIRSRIVQKHQMAFLQRRTARSEQKWADIVIALKALLL